MFLCIGGGVGSFRYGWLWTDPAAAVFISVLIIWSVVPLIQQSVEVLMLRVPSEREPALARALLEVHHTKHVCEGSGFLESLCNPKSLKNKFSSTTAILQLKSGNSSSSLSITAFFHPSAESLLAGYCYYLTRS
jgi:hypothetical protein